MKNMLCDTITVTRTLHMTEHTNLQKAHKIYNIMELA